jgi:hypothetical protein
MTMLTSKSKITKEFLRPLMCCWFVILAWSGLLVAASSTNNPSSYTSVRALDQFGHSIQLKHARESAHRHGRLVVAASSVNNKNMNNDTSTIVVVSVGNRPMVQSLTLPTTLEVDGASHHQLALCCTGVKGDANWLLMQVKQHISKVWERYNQQNMPPGAMAHVISRLLGSFEGEDWDQEWQSSLRRESSDTWARPLGIQTMIVSTQHPNLLLVEPSGRVLTTTTKKGQSSSFSFGAMGKDSSALQERLNRCTNLDLDSGDDDTTTDVAEVLKETLIQALLETLSRNDTIELMVETMTAQGIERTLVHYKNGKEISSTPVTLR